MLIIHTMELAIPLVVLAGTYIIANDEKKNAHRIQENFDTKTQQEETSSPTKDYQTETPSSLPVNWPKQNPEIKNTDEKSINKYQNSNQTTDPYFINTVDKVNQFNPPGSVSNSATPQVSLTGDMIDTQTFKHNNMVPFFGGKIKGCGPDYNSRESRLDSMQEQVHNILKKKNKALYLSLKKT